jgi:hypothetical protein
MPSNSSSSSSGKCLSSYSSIASNAFSLSFCELTETYYPAAIDIAPAIRPAIPAVKITLLFAVAPATPTTKPEIETIPSLAPSTAALSQLSWELDLFL